MKDCFIPDYEPLLVGEYEIDLRNPVRYYSERNNRDDLVELFVEEAGFMKDELFFSSWDSHKLDISKKEDLSQKKWVTDSTIPEWYTQLRTKYGTNDRRSKRHGTKISYRHSSVERQNTLRSLGRIINLEDFGIPHPKRFRVVPYDYEMRQIIFDRLTFEGYNEEFCCRIYPRVIVVPFSQQQLDDIPY